MQLSTYPSTMIYTWVPQTTGIYTHTHAHVTVPRPMHVHVCMCPPGTLLTLTRDPRALQLMEWLVSSLSREIPGDDFWRHAPV